MERRSPRKSGFFFNQDRSGICTVWAPEATTVEVALLSATPRFVAMKKDEMGYWSAGVDNIDEGTLYRLRLNEGDLYADPASLSQPAGVHGPSSVVDRNYPLWRDENWTGIALKDMIIYELHVGAFTKEGTFDGVIKKLPHLKALGINTIEIMPVAQFPGIHNWGYDGVFPYAVQHSYGGYNGLKSLVNEAHEAGFAVVLDMVYNHLGPEGNVLNAFGGFYTDIYKTPWSAAINLDGKYSYGVRDYFISNALMWLDEFHIDGLRLDAVHALYDTSATHFLSELEREVRQLEKTTGKKKVLIAESDLNNPLFINSKKIGGFNLDGQWNDEFHHALHVLLTGEKEGYYEDFGSIADLAKAFTRTFVYNGNFSVHRKRYFGAPVDNPYHQFVVCSQNHDQVGNRMHGERLSILVPFEALKLAALAVILSPYVPMLFMGEEYGERNPFLFFTDFSEEELINNVNEGRKKEFEHFGWESEPPHPQAFETFTSSVLSWDISTALRSSLLLFYKTLIQLRVSHPALKSNNRDGMTIRVHEPGIIAMKRFCGNNILNILMNFNPLKTEYLYEDNDGRIILDSNDKMFGGEHEQVEKNVKSGTKVTIDGFSALVFQQMT